MTSHPRNAQELSGDRMAALVAAAEPLWDILMQLGWTDGHGGAEFHRVFPAALDFIHREANVEPSG